MFPDDPDPRDAPRDLPPYGTTPMYPPPPTRPPADPRPPLSEAGKVRVVLAWSGVLLLTLLAVLVQREAMNLEPIDDLAAARPSFEMTTQGKVAIAIHRLDQNAPNPQAQREKVMEDFGLLVFTPQDQVRYAILSAEVYDEEEALWVIDELRLNQGMYEIGEEELHDLRILEDVYAGQPIDDAASDRLIERHGWFGELADTYPNRSSAQPIPNDPRRSGTTVIIIGLVLVLVAGLYGIAGLVFCILGIVMLSSGKLPPKYKPNANRRETPMLIEVMAVFLAVFAIGGAAGVYMVSQHRVDPGLITLVLLTLCPLIPLCYGIGWTRFCDLTGLRRGEGVFKEIAWGIAGYFAGLPLIVISFIVSAVLFYLLPVETAPPFDEFGEPGPVGLLLLVLLLVVWAPMVEEILFRGLFYSHCRRWMAWPVASIITGVIFAAIHPQWVWFIPGLASVGFVLAMIREWRGSLIGSITAHALHNGTIACFLVALLLA